MVVSAGFPPASVLLGQAHRWRAPSSALKGAWGSSLHPAAWKGHWGFTPVLSLYWFLKSDRRGRKPGVSLWACGLQAAGRAPGDFYGSCYCWCWALTNCSVSACCGSVCTEGYSEDCAQGLPESHGNVHNWTGGWEGNRGQAGALLPFWTGLCQRARTSGPSCLPG